MTAFTVRREVPYTPETVFEWVTDWERHGEAVPLTTITSTSDGFVARTGLGRIGFDDPMEIVAWDPPRSLRIEKRGRVVTGWAEIELEPTASGTLVTWREVAHTAGVPGVLAPLERAAGRALFGRVLDRVLRP